MSTYSVDDPFELAGELTGEEQLISSTVRDWVRRRFLPIVIDAWRAGALPDGLGAELGELGLLGMHLDGYGCGGASRRALRPGLRGARGRRLRASSIVSVQGSLAMFAIWKFGSEEQKQHWLRRMAAGELIGCFGLTEPDAGSDPAAMRTRARTRRLGWVLNGRKMWITNLGSRADVAVVWAAHRRRRHPRIPGPHRDRGFTPRIQDKLSLRASIT